MAFHLRVVGPDMPESGFNALSELIPNPKQPSVAVVILTRLVYATLREVVKNCGVKQATSAEQLDNAIQRAVASSKSGKCDS